jgi:hypothetical protein
MDLDFSRTAEDYHRAMVGFTRFLGRLYRFAFSIVTRWALNFDAKVISARTRISIVGIASAALLVGCGAHNVRKDYQISQHPGEGIAFLSVSHDLAGGRATTAIFYLDGTGSTIDLNRKTLTSLNDVMGVRTGSDFEDTYGQIYVVPLPAGRHRITGWQITNGHNLHIFPDGPLAPLEFSVVDGQVTYLGNLHARVGLGHNIFGMEMTNDGVAEVRDRQKRDIELFNSRYPELKDKTVVSLLPLGTWGNDDTLKRVNPTPIAPLPRK